MCAAKAVPRDPESVRTLDHERYQRYLPLVHRIAVGFARRVPAHVNIADLVGYGWLGVMDANSRAQPGMSDEEFEAYALYRARGAILDYLRSLDPVSRRGRTLCRQLRSTTQDLTKENGREPEELEVAARLGLEIQEYRALAAEVAEATAARLERFDIADLDPESPGAAPEEDVARQEIKDRVRAGIGMLPERLQMVLEMYYSEERTFREIGVALGVTESRVCQIHSEAVQRLRAAMNRR